MHITTSAKAATGASNPSARSQATSRSRWADCGSMDRISTTARFRPCAISWSRRYKGRLPSYAASTSWTRATAASSPPRDPRQPPAEGFCFDPRLVGNSNDGHIYGTTLSATEKGDLLAYLLTL